MPSRLYTRLQLVLLLSLLCGSPLAAAQRTHDIEPEDYFNIGVISSCVVSPDGLYAAYTEGRWIEDLDGRNTDLWVVEFRTRETRRLTFDPASDGNPTWSPDGKHLYFTSSRKRAGEKKPPYNGKRQVWRISPSGGVPQAVTRVEDGIGSYQLSLDGKSLYYTVDNEEFTEDPFQAMRKKYKHLEYGHGVIDSTQIWKLNLTTWYAKKLVDETRVVQAFSVSPDESRIAIITTPDNDLISNEGWSRVDMYDVATEKITVITNDDWRAKHPSPYGWIEGLAWSADSKALAFSISFDGYPSEAFVVDYGVENPSPKMIDRPDKIDIASAAFVWRGDTRELCFIGETRACKHVYGIQGLQDGKQGEMRVLAGGDIAVQAFGLDKAGDDLAVVLDTTKHPPEIYHVGIHAQPGGLHRITTVNPQVDTWKLPQISKLTWKGSDGDEVEGILELPPDYKKGDGPLPLIVELHGGPTSSTLYRFRLWIYGRALMPSKGYALLSPNYHGSTGYGREFMTKLIGRENEIEIPDIMNGVDKLIEMGIADGDRMGVMGWSNGGFLTNAIITHTDRFKAASSGAGVLDMVIQWGAEDTPGHVINYTQGLPWEKPEVYKHSSPVYGLGKVKTPTLIHVGGNDSRCPPAHSRALYRALKFYVDVPTELVVYPGEGHGLRKYKNRRAKMYWDLAWFDKYILEKDEDADGDGAADGE